jgi:predicted phage terminase large subunit-like protein
LSALLELEQIEDDAERDEAEQRVREAHALDWRDPIGRQADEVLWPAGGYDRAWMEDTRRALGSYWFSALYQQRPSPEEGMLFKRSNFLTYERTGESPDGSPIVTLFPRDGQPRVFDTAYGSKIQTMDAAASEKDSADWTVISTWIITPEREALLWAVDRERFDTAGVKAFARRVFFRESPQWIGIERLGHGLAIIQELVKEGIPVRRLEPDMDKVSRAMPAIARYEEGKVFHPSRASWLEDFESELLGFPNATHDDQVDTVSYMALKLPQIAARRVRSATKAQVHDGAGSSEPGLSSSIAAGRRRRRGRGTITGGLLDERT